MRFPLALLGFLILLLLLFEVLWTTMGLGGGTLTKFLSSRLHHLALFLFRRTQNRLWLAWSGIGIAMMVFVIWVTMLWMGWTLIFMGSETAVVNTQTGQPADFWERLYYVGFSIFTLGLGDFRPDGNLWRILTAVATSHGLFSVTFAITYLIPLVQAATQLRQIAITIASLGLSAQEIVINNWNGQSCTDLGEYLVSLVPSLAQLEQRHITYPVLHYFHSVQVSSSLAISVAALDEALTIVEHGLEESLCLSPAKRQPPRQVLTEFFHTLSEAYIKPADKAPPPPSLDALRRRGIPVVADGLFAERVAQLDERRRLLRAFVENKGWHWADTQIVDGEYNPDQPLEERWRQRHST